MTYFKSHLWVTLPLLILALAAWFGTEANRATVQTQGTEKVLEIERYPNEPMELVNVRIGAQSVKNRIKPKLKDNVSGWAIDKVEFKEKDDWFKHVSITLRNTSDKPVRGLNAFLFFKPTGFPMIFNMPLTSRELRHDPLAPGAEIELTVSQSLLNHTLADLKDRGTDVGHAVVSFSLDAVIFSDDLQWYRGKLVRPDSTTPGKWVPVDQPLAVNRKPLAETASFMRVSFKPATPLTAAPPVFATCQGDGGFITPVCSGGSSNCVQRIELVDGFWGTLSQVPESGPCIWVGGGTGSCSNSTTHTRLQTDATCFCPDPPSDERDYWMPGGGYDCTLCGDGIDNDCDTYVDGADSGCNPNNCASPVLIDVAGNGFNLTNTANGVNFDLDNDGIRERLSWTAPQADDAWLALDRNGDGAITNGTELFGNFTPQLSPPVGFGRNGFNALSEYDQPSKGGNDDGLITAQDSVFGNLRLWQDKNHNGISEANEISTLSQVGLKTIECYYRESKKRDQFGNMFRYRAKILDARNTHVNRWAWDVFLVKEASSIANRTREPIGNTTKTIIGWLRK